MYRAKTWRLPTLRFRTCLRGLLLGVALAIGEFSTGLLLLYLLIGLRVFPSSGSRRHR